MGLFGRAWRALIGESFDATETDPMPIDRLITAMLGRAANGPRVSRDQALGVPAVLKGRNIICGIATLPVGQYDAGHRPVRHPLLEQINPNVANVVTMAQTIEDLLFEAVSWWRV